MRKSCTAGLYVASTLGLLALSGTIHLNAEIKKLPTQKYNNKGVPTATDFKEKHNVKTLYFEKQELEASEKKLNADQLVKKAAQANKSAHYKEAIDYYLEAIKKLQALSPRNKTVEGKIQNCRAAIAKCYFYWAEQLYFEAWDDVENKQYDLAITKCRKASEILPSCKKKMDDAILKIQKLQKSAAYVSTLNEDKLVEDAESMRLLRARGGSEKKDGANQNAQFSGVDSELEGKSLAFSVDVKMRQGDAFFAEGLWTKARAKYEEVLALDPYHAEAIDSIRKSNRKLIQAGKRRRNVARQQYMSEAIWTPVIPLIPRTNAQNEGEEISGDDDVISKQQRDRTINDKLDKIIIPSLNFNDELVSEVLKKLQERTNDLTNGNGVNIVYLPYSGIVKSTSGNNQSNSEGGSTEEEPSITILNEGSTLRQAIQAICSTGNLKYKIEDHAVVIAPKNAPLDEHETRVFPIEKTTYDRLIKGGSLKDFFGKNLSINFADNAGVKYISGRLVVTHSPANIQRIKKYLDEHNKSDPQVLIETKFMEVAMNDIEELGFQYQVSRQNSNWRYLDSFDGSVRPSSNVPITSSSQTFNIYGGNRVNGYYQYMGTVSPGQDFTTTGNTTYYYTKAPLQQGGSQLSFSPNSANLVRNVNDIGSRTVMDGLFSAQYNDYKTGFSVNGAVRAIDQSDSADVMFCPRITTTNNYPATIKMVTKKYFPTDWEEAEVGTIASGGRDVPLFTSSIPELEEDEIGVRLDVQPSISTNGRTITLPMKPSVREHVGWIDYSYPVTVSVEENVSETFTNIIRMPIFEDRIVSTLVSCDDGETIILGGVVHDNTNSIDDQYPLLGDIPLIGRLFQSKAKISEKKNLLIFMTCRLINPDGTPVRESEMRGLPPFRQ